MPHEVDVVDRITIFIQSQETFGDDLRYDFKLRYDREVVIKILRVGAPIDRDEVVPAAFEISVSDGRAAGVELSVVLLSVNINRRREISVEAFRKRQVRKFLQLIEC